MHDVFRHLTNLTILAGVSVFGRFMTRQPERVIRLFTFGHAMENTAADDCPMADLCRCGPTIWMAHRNLVLLELVDDVECVKGDDEYRRRSCEPHGYLNRGLYPADSCHDGSLFDLQVIGRFLQDDLVVFIAG
jgi:hypothetical protein